ncbi:MAG: formate dehydrogenase accessory sulfurtransferase FdhD [Deferrisomatales bacterium]
MGAVPWGVRRFRGGTWEAVEDVVVDEVPLTLYVNGREVVTLLTLGEHPLELAVGFLRSEGFFAARDELLGWEEEDGAVRVQLARDVTAVERLLDKRTVTTGCGKGTTFYHALDALRCRPVASATRFAPEAVLKWMGELQRRSGLYRRTGGTHNASLADGARTVCFRTDIGRHNAVDMLGGWAFLNAVDLGRTALLTTGRISSEILIKGAKMGAPLIVSRSAPTALALRLARELNVTVVGYVRNGRFNVYTHGERLGAAQADPGALGGAGYG